MYHLKKNVADFTVVDGPFAGRSYHAGKSYAEIPPQEKHKFEEARRPAPAVKPPAAKGDTMQQHIPLNPETSSKKTKKQAAR
jgi:hypothetical protein